MHATDVLLGAVTALLLCSYLLRTAYEKAVRWADVAREERDKRESKERHVLEREREIAGLKEQLRSLELRLDEHRVIAARRVAAEQKGA